MSNELTAAIHIELYNIYASSDDFDQVSTVFDNFDKSKDCIIAISHLTKAFLGCKLPTESTLMYLKNTKRNHYERVAFLFDLWLDCAEEYNA